MKEILEKLTSYNLFNYLLPGVVFVAIAKIMTPIDLIQKDLVTGAFLYYFIGLVISRLGSVCIEPLLKKAGFVKFECYEKFLSASKKDAKIEILLEANNMYRTFVAVFITVLLLKIYFSFEPVLPILGELRNWVLLAFLIALFLFSYRKQTKYIASRIKEKSDV